MKEIGKEELKKVQLEILISIHEFCEQKGLRYSLSCGTLLGAVRHQGYIPWDDGIDIMMPRPDYEKFRKMYPGFKENHTVQSYHNDDSYWFNFLKVYDNRTLFIEGAARNGVYVDVFPVDGLPNAPEAIKRICVDATLLVNRDLRWTTKEYKVRTKRKDILLHRMKYQYRKHLVDSRKIVIKRIDRMFLGHSFENSPMAGIFFFNRMFGVLPRSMYENYKLMHFEDRLFYSVDDSHMFLESLYGDYMQLPPVEQRVGHHNIHAYWL